MSQIKSKNTKPEMLIRQFLHANGFRFRLHKKGLPGRPDIVLEKYKTVVNVHGCYFHRHKNCQFCSTPADTSKTNWKKKFADNVARDKKNSKALKRLGYKEITVWECSTKSQIKLLYTYFNLLYKLS